ncbi:MAG TPA: acyl-CoA dehydrogenase family protein [Streptosporangiaceae bacterium]|nr:acyl-CoA dehydrogenase family protein [Streptosporangiaceae bacterium]
MDFDLDEAQQVIAASVADVLGSAARGSEPPDGAADWLATWQALAKAGLLALTLPEWMDGDGLGVLDTAVLLTEVGRRAVVVPALATLMLGTLPVVRWGSRDLQERVLTGVGTGEVILTAGVREPSTGMPAWPATTADLAAGPAGGEDPAGSGLAGTVTGLKIGVPFAADARWMLVPAALAAGGRAVVVVDASAEGVSVAATPASSAVPEYTVRLDAAPVAGVLGTGSATGTTSAAVDDLYLLAACGAAALADGAMAGALALTAGYVAGREQFGRPLATFQAVAGQIADVYIASRTLHLAALSACWRLASGRDAAQDAGIAAYWLAQEGPVALRTCHQLHGGIGMDVGYPLHRYSSMVSDLARFVGGADYRLELLADHTDLGAQCS